MRIFKFLLLILLIAPINAFGECVYDNETACNNHYNDGCYWDLEGGVWETQTTSPSCKTCLFGSYIETTDGKKSCELCPEGSYCTGNGQATPCPAGEYSDPGAISCKPCPAGHYCENGIKYTCPAGYYCVDGFKKPCPAGTYSGVVGLTTEDECTPCEKGKYSSSTGRTSACTDECTSPSRPEAAFGSNYSFDFSSGGYSPDSCQWWFSCASGTNLRPVCLGNSDGGYNCSCQSCGAPYEGSSSEQAMTLVFDGSTVTSDPNSNAVCPKFEPLYLYTQSWDTPEQPISKNYTFHFYVIINDDQVLLSPTKDTNPENYKQEIQIDNVYLKNGINYSVSLSIGDCKFETTNCGRYDRTGKCTVNVGKCTADQLRREAGDKVDDILESTWNLDIPVLIAKAKMVFNDKDRDNKLHILYSDNECYKWYDNPGLIEKIDDGSPKDDFTNCSVPFNEKNGYNKKEQEAPFLGYTIGCWRKEYTPASQGYSLNSQFIMLDDDFLYPSDCSVQSALPKDPNKAVTASVQQRVWPGVRNYTFDNISFALADVSDDDIDKRCFIVGLYSYPPCSPGCYCPNGTSSSCGDGAPFTSKRGSSARTDCYLKSDVSFIEGTNPVTDELLKLMGISSSSYIQNFKLLNP